jgi:hypothetical protein
MLRPSSARHASTCLQCHLRLALRQFHHRRYQSTHDSSPLRDFSVNDHTPTNLRITRVQSHHGRIRGKKGRQRRVESSEPLGIDSLGESSEVIVLRDLPEVKPAPEPPKQHELEDEQEKPRALSAKDIENMSGKRAPRASSDEVFESIESLRPEGELKVIPKSEFEAIVTTMTKGYNLAQLKGYLMRKTTSLISTSMANELQPSQSDQETTESSELSSLRGGLHKLKRTLWYPGTTTITRRLPLEKMHMEPQAQRGRRLGIKERTIESILRGCWTLSTEEEEASTGEMEFLLSPMQFGLLLTKNSETLRPLLESSKFYKNSHFQLHQADHVIRIFGPRAEAEGIAVVLTESFAVARSAEINLDTDGILQQMNLAGLTVEETFHPPQLQKIMDLTKTYISYDAETKRLQIASFVGTAINDAHRLLMALLPVQARDEIHVLYDRDVSHCRLEQVSASGNLPLRAQLRQLGRWVTPSSRLSKSGENLLARDRPIITRALEMMEAITPQLNHFHPPVQQIIWPLDSRVGVWKARIGRLLHDARDQKSVYPGTATETSTEASTAFKPIFTSQFPGLAGLLSHAKALSATEDYSLDGGTELIAHLIPSPLEAIEASVSSRFPKIELRFAMRSPSTRESNQSSGNAEEHEGRSVPLKDGRSAVFREMTAVVKTDIVQLALPASPVDVEFQRIHTLSSTNALKDDRIRLYVEAIFESLVNDTTLRAPPVVQIALPRRALGVGLKVAAKLGKGHGTGKDLVPVKYLFSSFEHREKRNFKVRAADPNCRVRIETVEAGVTGGRRVELSILMHRHKVRQLKFSGAKQNLEQLASAAVGVVNSLAKAPNANTVNHYGADWQKNDMWLEEQRQGLREATQSYSLFKKERKRAPAADAAAPYTYYLKSSRFDSKAKSSLEEQHGSNSGEDQAAKDNAREDSVGDEDFGTISW